MRRPHPAGAELLDAVVPEFLTKHVRHAPDARILAQSHSPKGGTSLLNFDGLHRNDVRTCRVLKHDPLPLVRKIAKSV